MLNTRTSFECPNCQTKGQEMTEFYEGCGEKLAARNEPGRVKARDKVVPLKRRPKKRPSLTELRADFVEVVTEKAGGRVACRTIAFCNQKGGVGKTVTAINLSARLAALGLRTLLIDFDPQGQSGLGLGLDVDSLDRSVYDVVMNRACSPEEAIVPLRPNLEILPSNIDLTSAELDLASFERRERRLKEVIDSLRVRYDYIVIDCPPSVGILTVNALVASDVVVVPVTPSPLSVLGLSRVMQVLDALNDSFSLEVKVLSLLTFFDKRLREANRQKKKIESTFGRHLLTTVVRKNTKLNEATRKGVSIFEYARSCAGARDYTNLAREILSFEYGKEPAAEEAMRQQGAF